MEDEDNENGLVDKWTLWEEAYYKGAGVNDTSLAQINNSNVSLDDIDETREDCFYSPYAQGSGGNGNSDANLKNVIKGIKKNILKTQPEENQADSLNDSVSAQTNDTAKDKTDEMVEVKEKNMAEYAQYLGLQPASSKPECSKCHALKSNTSPGESNQNKCDCSAEDSSRADADSSKLSLVNNAELPSTSSPKPACTENSQLSILDDPELLHTNDCNSQPADATTPPSAEAHPSALASSPMSPSADTSGVSCADGSKSPDADEPESLPTETPRSPPAEASQSPPAEISVLSPKEASPSPAPEIVQSPAADVTKSPSVEDAPSPAADAPMSLSVEEPQSPAADAPMSPSVEEPQSPAADAPMTPSVEEPQSPAANVPKSPSEEEAQSLAADVPMSPSVEEPQSPAANIPKSPSVEEPQSPAADVYMSPSVKKAPSPSTDVHMSPPNETFQSSPMETPQSPSVEEFHPTPMETSQSPSVEEIHSPSVEEIHSPSVEASRSPYADVPVSQSDEASRSPSVEASRSPHADVPVSQTEEASRSPSVETSRSPFAGAFQSPRKEASQSPSADVCMSPVAERLKSPLLDASNSSPAQPGPGDLQMLPSTDASQSPISNDIEFLSTGSPKPQPGGSESPASTCSQRPTLESASCDSTELPPAESSQSPPQFSMELSGDSNSKELQTDGSEVSVDKGEPVPSTSYEQSFPSTSYEEPIPSTSSCRSPSTSTLDSSSASSGVQSTSQPPNFKITNKVYLCAACETYFENWNLFTHMREVHQRHICLFCLGMFGQAEKLSHHLLKKHNVADMNFQSKEEFFKVFIGPCYVVCCACEKMFTETDNFENHFCPPREAVQSTSGVCSQCKKIDSHAEGCRLAPEKSDNKTVLESLPNSARTTNVEPTKPNQTVTNVIRHSKRTIKPNRHNDDIYLYTKLTNIRTKRPKLQSTSETSDSACSETLKDVCATEVTRNSFSDPTVEEIRTDGADNTNSFQNERLSYGTFENRSHKSESERLSRVSAKDTYDSVTETIMEVSQGTNVNDSVRADRMSSSDLENTLDCSTSKGTVESSEPKDEDDVRLREKNATSDETKELHVESNSFDNTNENYNSDSESQASDSSSNAEDESFDTNDTVPTKKEQTKPVLSATPVNRSLVIKICTKNNSVYSIKTPSHIDNSIENHDSSRESEENNNSEESDKTPAAEESVKSVLDDENADEEKMDVTENCENDLGSINFDSDVNKENQSDVNNQLDKKSEENLDEKRESDAVDGKIENFDGIPLAGEEIATVDLEVDDLLENMELEELLKRCIKAVSGICVYCNHARHIAVNGKQLSLHMLSEHRFQPQHPAIIINQELFVAKVKKCFNELDSYFFNLDSYNTKQGTYNVSTLKTYECFHCRFYSNSHKELYLHNRKMHQKPILICIMCKSTFLSYSELLCHLCPGVYAANVDIKYRCCMCDVSNIPSAFRLMVHLRKLHHACDVCLETTGNQQNLSNHVWKHKLHHLCYRCGIAYRNKPDITKHLFWKHGTESVLCKKCLQKKWPYIYHFCVPPAGFHCEECGFVCSKAVALKVHKRIHANEYPYSCSECPEKLISKKLLAKHERSHREPEPPRPVTPVNTNDNGAAEEDVHVDVCDTEVTESEAVEAIPEETPKEPVKKVVDVLDLPPLNLSDSDSDSDDDEAKPEESKSNDEPEKIETDVVDKPETVALETPITTDAANDVVSEVERNETEKKQEEQIMDGIWDNFKSYTASLEKQESMEVDGEKPAEGARTIEEIENLRKVILADHDYWVVYPDKGEEGQSPSGTAKKTDDSVEADKANLPVDGTPSPSKPPTAEGESPKKKVKSPKKKKQNTSGSSSDSSSDSDSSNCSCGTGCSCSSSSSSGSSSSSSSSDSDSSAASESSPKKASREKRKKAKAAAKAAEEKNEVIAEPQQPEPKPEVAEVTDEVAAAAAAAAPIVPPKPLVVPVLVIRESDLETTETDTDEEFYDENPQQTASKLLAEKRKQMLIASGIPMDAAPAPMNGVIDTDASTQSAAAAAAEEAAPEQVVTPAAPAAGKRKFKTRKRRKGLWGKARTPSAKTVESIKINIPKASYQRRGAPRGRRHSTVSNVSNASAYEAHQTTTTTTHQSATPQFARTQSLGGSGSELDSTRSSKRRRVPKRFYDDSSDEENHMQRMLKWRRTDAPPIGSLNAGAPSPSSSKQSFQQQQQLLLQQQQHQQQLLIQQQQQLIMQQQQQQLIIQQQQQQLQYQQEQLLQAQRQQQQQHQQQQYNEDDEGDEKALVIAASDSDSSSSSDSTDSENETTTNAAAAAAAAAAAKNEVPAVAVPPPPQPNAHTLFHSNFPQMHPIIPERSSNLYCYCQCPYDEVSEMIACDGDDCQIEWFHFECVGISVPPKGKWYCPDCRKNLGMSDEELANG